MMRRSMLAVLASATLGVHPCGAVTADSAAVLYQLVVPPSSYQTGCFGPCECAVAEQPTYGSFELVPIGADPLYRYYAVEHYIASFNNGPGAVAITGSGRYKIGGEFAYTQQLTMDIQVFGGPVQHFDSGVKSVTAPFPAIDIACAAHGFACVDTVLEVDAKPATASVPGEPRISRIAMVRPNPFDRATSIEIDLARASVVEIEVFDPRGGFVRRLAYDPLASGRHVLPWDGRRGDGRVAPAGIYWVRMTWPGGTDGRRIVKLD